MPVKDFLKDESSDVIDKEFKEFCQDVFGAERFFKEDDMQYSMYVPGKLTRAEFDEGMIEFCDRYGLNYELVDQAPGAPSRQYFSENMKLMYPAIKDYENLIKNEGKFRIAKKLFKQQWNQEFNPEDEDDREDIVLLFNEYMEEQREWKLVEVHLIKGEEKEEEI